MERACVGDPDEEFRPVIPKRSVLDDAIASVLGLQQVYAVRLDGQQAQKGVPRHPYKAVDHRLYDMACAEAFRLSSQVDVQTQLARDDNPDYYSPGQGNLHVPALS